jgi:hypothetical protein
VLHSSKSSGWALSWLPSQGCCPPDDLASAIRGPSFGAQRLPPAQCRLACLSRLASQHSPNPHPAHVGLGPVRLRAVDRGDNAGLPAPARLGAGAHPAGYRNGEGQAQGLVPLPLPGRQHQCKDDQRCRGLGTRCPGRQGWGEPGSRCSFRGVLMMGCTRGLLFQPSHVDIRAPSSPSMQCDEAAQACLRSAHDGKAKVANMLRDI